MTQVPRGVPNESTGWRMAILIPIIAVSLAGTILTGKCLGDLGKKLAEHGGPRVTCLGATMVKPLGSGPKDILCLELAFTRDNAARVLDTWKLPKGSDAPSAQALQEKIELARQSIRVDWLFILSYVVFWARSGSRSRGSCATSATPSAPCWCASRSSPASSTQRRTTRSSRCWPVPSGRRSWWRHWVARLPRSSGSSWPASSSPSCGRSSSCFAGPRAGRTIASSNSPRSSPPRAPTSSSGADWPGSTRHRERATGSSRWGYPCPGAAFDRPRSTSACSRRCPGSTC